MGMTGAQLREQITTARDMLGRSPESFFTGPLAGKAKRETRELWVLAGQLRAKIEEQWAWVDTHQNHPQREAVIDEICQSLRVYEAAVSLVETTIEVYGFPLEEQAVLMSVGGGYHYG